MIKRRSTITRSHLTKDIILDRISQEEIFAYFLNISVSDIQRAVSSNTLLHSAFRHDPTPSMGFTYRRDGKLVCRDFGGYFWGDCFDVVKYINHTSNFMEILTIIADAFQMFTAGRKESIISNNGTFTIQKAYKEFTFEFRDWNKHDIARWGSWGCDMDVVDEYDVKPVEEFYINGYLYAVGNNYKYPIYAAYLGMIDNKQYWKINLPGRVPKYISNGDIIQGIRQIKKVDKGGIIKSLKDTIALRSAASRRALSLQGLAPNSENTIIDLQTFNFIAGYYKDIFTFSDFDRTGIMFGNRMRKAYKTKPYFLTNGRFESIDFCVKDLCEYAEYYGNDMFDDLIERVYNNEPINKDDYKSNSESSVNDIPF